MLFFSKIPCYHHPPPPSNHCQILFQTKLFFVFIKFLFGIQFLSILKLLISSKFTIKHILMMIFIPNYSICWYFTLTLWHGNTIHYCSFGGIFPASQRCGLLLKYISINYSSHVLSFQLNQNLNERCDEIRTSAFIPCVSITKIKS